jgi:hypothetical protein
MSGSARCFAKPGMSAGRPLPASPPPPTTMPWRSMPPAVLVTHDREFTRRRMQNTIGRHVRLDCEQPDAVALIGVHLGELVAALEIRRRESAVILRQVDPRRGPAVSSASSSSFAAPAVRPVGSDATAPRAVVRGCRRLGADPAGGLPFPRWPTGLGFDIVVSARSAGRRRRGAPRAIRWSGRQSNEGICRRHCSALGP